MLLAEAGPIILLAPTMTIVSLIGYSAMIGAAGGATAAIPNDPSNDGRALQVLAEVGLIKVNPAAGPKAGPADVTENPKNIRFSELDAAQLPRSLADVDAGVNNTNYVLEAGLHPKTDAIAIEGQESPMPT